MTGNGSLPLARFNVLDLTRARAGPTCVRQLVDWGARAIKIESLRPLNPRLVYGSISGFGQSGPYQDLYARFCAAIARPDLLTDERFATSKARSRNRDTLMEVLMPVTRQKTSAEWIGLLNEAGVPCGPIYRVDEAFADPQVQHLKMAQPVHAPALGEVTILGHPVAWGETRHPIRTAAPELGQDNEDILTGLGYTKDQIADLSQRGII